MKSPGAVVGGATLIRPSAPTGTFMKILNAVGIASGAMPWGARSEEHTSELQSLMRISYAVFCLKKKISNYHHCDKIIISYSQQVINKQKRHRQYDSEAMKSRLHITLTPS